MPIESSATHGRYSISLPSHESNTIYQVLALSGQLRPVTITPKFPLEKHIPNPHAEALGLSKMDVNEASALFENNRKKVMQALRALAGYVFQQYNLPRENGADFGCGATGAMVHEFLKDEINPQSWTEIDIHPDAVKMNKQRHPAARVITGSYHDIPSLGIQNSLQIATGLSSLDASFYTDHAIKQITSSIIPGGYFLHIQDVRPGSNVVFKSLEEMGEKPPYHAEVAPSSKNDSNMVLYETAEGLLSVVELFRRRIGRAISRNPDLELLTNSWVVAQRKVSDGETARLYQANICLDIPRRDQLNQLPAHLAQLIAPRVGFEQASAVVTVARKIK